ncbi:MAG TPA: ABC transporter ATP-binding protein [Bacteroidales bacterium]|nr:ATP-binding cassette domain-containing protein [Bacteroidales bacterium]HNR40781.1 ABC transporter ATP-binding protein [Bacteroidales bacterium]HQG76063.1 ABC transporter ATP-binding protein [Bacteroidales bacterium]
MAKQTVSETGSTGVPLTSNTVITVRNLVKKFGNFIANDNLNFEVFRGEIFGFLGANGAGKTTALRILSGLSSPTSGKVMVAGYDAKKEPEQIKKNIGYMCQKFSLYNDLTVRENIMLYGGIYGMSKKLILERTAKLLERLQFEEYGGRLIADLPLGLKQKLAFSVAVMHEPKIVFLDEPTGGVDPITRRQFWEMIYETAARGITVFVTTHYMDEAEYCDRISIMNEGRIVALDTPANLKKQYNADSVEEVFIKIARPSPADPGMLQKNPKGNN